MLTGPVLAGKNERTRTSRPGWKRTIWGIFLALAVFFSSDPGFVQASPLSESASYTIAYTVNKPLNPICKNQTSRVSAYINETTSFIRNNRPATRRRTLRNRGITVTAYTLDNSIATVNPSQADTGWIRVGEDGPQIRTRANAANFTVTAMKAGTTALNFYSLVPGTITHGRSVLAGNREEIVIKVIDCNFRLDLNMVSRMNIAGAKISIIGWMKNVQVRRDDSGKIDGSGEVQALITATKSGCTVRTDQMSFPAKITGTATDNTITLIVAPELATGDFTGTCPSLSGSRMTLSSAYSPALVFMGNPLTVQDDGSTAVIASSQGMMTSRFEVSLTPIKQ